MTKLEVGKVYKNRKGEDIRIICVDRHNPVHPVIGLRYVDGSEDIDSFTSSGRNWSDTQTSTFDLLIPGEPKSGQIWRFEGGELVLLDVNTGTDVMHITYLDTGYQSRYGSLSAFKLSGAEFVAESFEAYVQQQKRT